MEAHLREYYCYDVTGVVDLWNQCLPADSITREIFDDKVLLDPNFDPAGCWVAMQNRGVVGFTYALVRCTPLPWGFESTYEHDRQTGWIFALFVHEDYRRQGIGSALLGRALAFLEAKGVRNVILGNYAPNYVLSGVDEEAYPGAQQFFEHHGFVAQGKSYGMGIDLHGFRKPREASRFRNQLEKELISVEYFRPVYLLPTLDFLRECFPTWLSLFIDKLQRGHDHRQMVIARQGERVIGYCQRGYGRQAERTGPFGVKEEFRGRKIGTLMLHFLLARMAQEGLRFGWFAQTGDRQRKYYERVGYRVLRTQVGMVKRLY